MSQAKQVPQASSAALPNPMDGNYINDIMSPKKTALILVTVVGCIAILWPSVFYPMFFGTPPKMTNLKEQQLGGCCDVVLDSERFVNSSNLRSSIHFGPQIYRKHMELFIDDITLPQERPVKSKQDGIYEAMRERGRAIPSTQSVPIVERKTSTSRPAPRVLNARPPIPGMRPPMGGGAMHQPQPKGSSMGILMPIYTIGIIVFFVYTIMKIVARKPIPNAPYGPAPVDPNFRREVFGVGGAQTIEHLQDGKLGWREHQTSSQAQSRLNPNGSNELYNASIMAGTVASQLSTSLAKQRQGAVLGPGSGLSRNVDDGVVGEKHPPALYQEKEQLMEIDKLRKKLEATERAMAKLINEMNLNQFDAKKITEAAIEKCLGESFDGHANEHEGDLVKAKQTNGDQKPEMQLRKRREYSAEREMTVLGMEVTASYEGGRIWTGRPITPELICYSDHSKHDNEEAEPQSIYLKGTVAHDSQILVADTETKREVVYDPELNGSEDEPAVILSSKMTLSLINLDTNHANENEAAKSDIESPLADDIEIIGHDER